MLTEINTGAEWWRQRVQHAAKMLSFGLPQQFDHFQSTLTSILQKKYQNHWYNDEPTRGQAFRAILNDESGPDRSLIQALTAAGLPLNLCGHQDIVMWIDSGSVSVRCKGGEVFDLYKAPVPAPAPQNYQVPYKPATTHYPTYQQPTPVYASQYSYEQKPSARTRTSPQLREVVNYGFPQAPVYSYPSYQYQARVAVH